MLPLVTTLCMGIKADPRDNSIEEGSGEFEVKGPLIECLEF